MEGGIRDTYRPAVERLAAGTSAQSLITMAEQLQAVAALLAREPRLRRALADSVREPGDRTGLVEGVLRGKVDDAVIELVGDLVAQRWAGPRELRSAAERLAVDAYLASAAKTGDLGEVEDELFRFAQLVDGAPHLAAALVDPGVPMEHRLALVDDLLAGKARAVTVRLVQFALTGFGGRGFSASLARLVDLAAAARDRTVAYVTAAVPLSDADEQRLATALAQRYGWQVSVQVRVDPRLIGGLSVQIGSDLYDGTVAHRLSEALAALSK